MSADAAEPLAEAAEPEPEASGDGEPTDDTPPASTTQTHFRFMDLPPEIRENIYRLAMPPPNHRTEVRVGDSMPSIGKLEQHSMAQVCRVVRQEAVAVYFSDTIFGIRISRNCRHACGPRWLSDQEEVAVSCMRKIVLTHCSASDHGGKYHRARIHVDMVKRTVKLDESKFHSCDECIEQEVVPKIVKQIQEVVDGMEVVDGRQRLTKALLGEMISFAEGICIP